jgi:cysteate synthase
MKNKHYRLACVRCGAYYDDDADGFLLDCPERHPPSLLRAVYDRIEFSIKKELSGIFRYRDWLPIGNPLARAGRPVVYQSERLASALGLEKLFIAFNGYWPARGARLETCSFKELEAMSVCARAPRHCGKSLVVSSAGNTGRAFLQMGSLNAIPLVVVVPESALPDMWITVDKHPCVKLAVVEGGADYFDAIQLGNTIASQEGYYPEGGAKNTARRDGMGTVLLSAAEAMGEIPDHYFQAVGSGTGGIAAWEMARRLAKSGSMAPKTMKLHFVQNEPFAVMTEAWKAGSRELPVFEEREAKGRISRLHSKVLSNRKPPYGIAGGVFDALTETKGEMYAVANEEAASAGDLFESLEGADIDPAAEVAIAGLIHAVRDGKIGPAESVLLNVTGGGSKIMEEESRKRPVKPDFAFRPGEAPESIREKLSGAAKD